MNSSEDNRDYQTMKLWSVRLPIDMIAQIRSKPDGVRAAWVRRAIESALAAEKTAA